HPGESSGRRDTGDVVVAARMTRGAAASGFKDGRRAAFHPDFTEPSWCLHEAAADSPDESASPPAALTGTFSPAKCDRAEVAVRRLSRAGVAGAAQPRGVDAARTPGPPCRGRRDHHA